MHAVGALPTEKRVKDMTDIQWLWFYESLKKLKEEEETFNKNRIDYLTWFINPKMAKEVNSMNNVSNTSQDTGYNNINGEGKITIQKETTFNDSFEEEIMKVMQENNDQFVVLPEDGVEGNQYETQEDFLSRVMEMEQNLGINNEIEDKSINVEDEFMNLEDYEYDSIEIIEEDE